MAEQTDAERTEPASPRRLEQAREEGQVPRSQELTTCAMMLTAAGGLWLLGPEIFERLRSILRQALTLDPAMVFVPAQMGMSLQIMAADALLAIMPLLGLLLLVAFAAPQLLSGWLFSTGALKFNFGRLDPLAGIGRIISVRGAIDLVKAVLKAALVGGVAVVVIMHYREPVQALGLLPIETGIIESTRMVGLAFLAVASTFVVIAALDVPYQLWRHAEDHKMSRQEVRQENRESEGDPQIKAAIRAQQRAIARKRMMSEVPKASVIITNPTHYAVAIRYDEQSMRAPRVVAKGAGLLAERIREVGAAHRVPLLEAPPLARALYGYAEIGAEIPEELYTAVAEVLAYVFQLRVSLATGVPAPQEPHDIAVPSGLDKQDPAP
jgi:flagellar biosynthetic protein FlhB